MYIYRYIYRYRDLSATLAGESLLYKRYCITARPYVLNHFATRRATPPQRCVRGPCTADPRSIRHSSRNVSFI